MSRTIDPNAIPGMESVEIKKEKVELKNVLFGKGGREDITVEVVPFDPYDDSHVEFAYAYSDMLFRQPSPFKSASDAAQGYVRTFMAHTKEDEANPDSAFRKVFGDVRACRTLMYQNDFMQAMNDFFENV